MLMMTRNEAIPYDAMKAGMLWDWVTFPEWLDSLERMPKGINVFTYMPLTPLYVWVMGVEAARSRRPNEAELKEMCRLLHQAMDAGACGWSAQVLGEGSDQRDFDGAPMITDLMTQEEVLAFARVLGERDEGYIELTYHGETKDSRFDHASDLWFFERVAEVARRPVLFQAVGVFVSKPELHRRILDWLDDCCRRGLRIYGQGFTMQYAESEFTFKDWNMFDNSPAWREVTVGSPAERRAKMEDSEMRAKLREEWESGIRPGQVGVIDDRSLAALLVGRAATREYERYQGRTIGDIADEQGKPLVDALLDIVVAEDLRTEFVAMPDRNDAHLTGEVLRSPYVVRAFPTGAPTPNSRPSDAIPPKC